MIIRKLAVEDKSQVLAIVARLFAERLEQEGFFYHPDYASKHFDLLAVSTEALGLCLEENGLIVGIIIGIKSAIIFSKEVAMQEIVWYVEPGYRKWGIKLLKAFEETVKNLDGEFMMLTTMNHSAPEKVYNRLGYKQTQQTFIKRLI